MSRIDKAYANIYASIGQDTFGNIDTVSSNVAELAEHLKSHWTMLEQKFLVEN